MPRSRCALVFFVILYFLAVVRRGVWRPTITRRNLLDTLFLPDELVNGRKAIDRRQWPAGRSDPLRLVYRFIDVVDRLIELNAALSRGISSLTLGGLGVLRACAAINGVETRRFTLLAYCGGCGRRPLYPYSIEHDVVSASRNSSSAKRQPSSFSHMRLCPKCLYVICPDCQCCSRRCAMCPPVRA